MADCGDGWNSSYGVARMMAQPQLKVAIEAGRASSSSSTGVNRADNGASDVEMVLPRAKLLLVGGDLAYPHPSPENYESR